MKNNSLQYNIIWLNGMPRSGTSWLSQIYDSHPDVNFKLSPLFSYQFKNVVNESSTIAEWNSFLDDVYQSDDLFINQVERRKRGEYPEFEEKFETPQNLVIKDTRYHNLTYRILELFPDIKIIHIVRNPCGAINSWLKAPREFPANADIFENWKTGAIRKTAPEEFWGFDDWKKITAMYIELENRFPNTVFVVKYEDLVNNPVDVTKKMFEFSGLIIHKQTISFLELSHKINLNSEYAVFKDKSVKNNWKKELPDEIQGTIFHELRGTNLERFLD